jgi:hypothetical protein
VIIALSGYAAYFDASHGQDAADKKIVVVAGYVSTVEEWAQFEMGWKLTLAKFDVPYFHMKEFTACKKAFSHPKWKSEGYRASFISDLAQIIRGWTVASVGSAMRQDLFDRYNCLYKLDERFNPYAISGRDCTAHVRKFIRNEVKSDLPIGYIFERGDEGRGFLMKEMEASGLPTPQFKRSRPHPTDPQIDKDDPFLVQLQASDFFAWELRRGEKDLAIGKKGSQLRKSLRSLAAMKRIWHETKESDLQGLIIAAKVEERHDNEKAIRISKF